MSAGSLATLINKGSKLVPPIISVGVPEGRFDQPSIARSWNLFPFCGCMASEATRAPNLWAGIFPAGTVRSRGFDLSQERFSPSQNLIRAWRCITGRAVRVGKTHGRGRIGRRSETPVSSSWFSVLSFARQQHSAQGLLEEFAQLFLGRNVKGNIPSFREL